MRISAHLVGLLLLVTLLMSACTSASTTPSATTLSPANSPTMTVVPPTSASPIPPSPAPSTPMGLAPAEVVRVVDGDTIEVRIDGRQATLRYIGVDTPESVDPRQPVQWLGKEASEKNAELVGGKTVQLEKDVSETDRFGRLLRYVWVDDKMVNEELVRLGYTQVVTYPPDVKYQDRFLAAQREAREAGRGLWSNPDCIG